jgi:hypothetical protein
MPLAIIGGSVVNQAREMASGTFASLTNICNYDRIYEIRLAFI